MILSMIKEIEEVMILNENYKIPRNLNISKIHSKKGGRRGRDRMVVSFTTTSVTRPYHH